MNLDFTSVQGRQKAPLKSRQAPLPANSAILEGEIIVFLGAPINTI